MLLRLAYLTVTNTFAVLRLFPMSDRDKDTEILALRLSVPKTWLRTLSWGVHRFVDESRAGLQDRVSWVFGWCI